MRARYVGNFDPCPSKALRAEVPGLESAITSLASASSKLADKFPELGEGRAGRMPCVWARSFTISVDAAGSCGVHSFLGMSSSMLRGSTSTALSFAEMEAGAAGSVSGLVHRMNSMPDADGAVSSARSEGCVGPFRTE